MITVQTALIALALAAPAPVAKEREEYEALIKEWQATLRPVKIDELLADKFFYLDPRPTREFVKFTGERLDAYIAEDSKSTFKSFFQNEANPFANGKDGPDRYSLAPRPGRRSLLLYSWKTYRHRFRLLESSNAVLLFVRPHDGLYSDKGDLSTARAAAILERVLNPEVVGKGKSAMIFRLPDVLRPGQVLSNAGPLTHPTRNWKENIMVFLTDADLCVLLLKAWSPRQSPELHPKEEEWLPLYLKEKDEDKLVIERLWGKPYPRPAPAPRFKNEPVPPVVPLKTDPAPPAALPVKEVPPVRPIPVPPGRSGS